MTNNHHMMRDIKYEINSKMSDHNTITADLPPLEHTLKRNNVSFYTTTIPDYNLETADEEEWKHYEKALNECNFTEESDSLSMDDTVKLMNSTIEDIVSSSFTVKTKGDGMKKPPPKIIQDLMNKKDTISCSLITANNKYSISAKIDQLRKTEVKLKEKIQDLERKEEHKHWLIIHKDPKKFYKYATKSSKSRHPIGPFLDEEGKLIKDDSENANVLLNQYCRMFSTPLKERQVEDSEDFFQNKEKSEGKIFFDLTSVMGYIKNSNSASSPGLDGIHPLCFKRGGKMAATMIAVIMRKSITEKKVPTAWKKAIISPIYKKGASSDPANYRPISLTSVAAKIAERIIKNGLLNHLNENNLFDPRQHGCRSGHSCQTQLLEQYQDVLKMIEDGDNADMVMLDYEKAFDKVDVGTLKHKIRSIGVVGELGIWISEFLTDRFQSVKVNNWLSKWAAVVSGVPQGSVLGSILFVIYIMDLGLPCMLLGKTAPITHFSQEGMIVPTLSNTQETEQQRFHRLRLFVDDTKSLMKTRNFADIKIHQEILDGIYDWEKRNNMNFNKAKFQRIIFGKNKTLQDSDEGILYSGGGEEERSVIELTDFTRDLGIIISSDAKFDKQRLNAISKMRRQSCWILRVFKTRDPAYLVPLWNSLVQPFGDFCSSLWKTNVSNTKMMTIEGPMRSFTRRLNGMKDLDYHQRLSKLGLMSQQRRGEFHKIVHVFKITRRMIPNAGIIIKTENPNETRSGGGIQCIVPSLKGKIMSVRTLKDEAFGTQGPILWNLLPLYIRNIPGTIPQFKSLLKEWCDGIPDMPIINSSHCSATSAKTSNSLQIMHKFKTKTITTSQPSAS